MIDHGVILKVVTTNICGSDQHMVRGRTTAPAGMVLGHEIAGEVIDCYGPIHDLQVLRALPRFPKMWVEQDPSVTMAVTQSASLPVPGRIEASLSVTVR
jgi:hypothetical protein